RDRGLRRLVRPRRRTVRRHRERRREVVERRARDARAAGSAPGENGGTMPSALPIADPAPADGLLPESVTEGWGARDFGVYVHVPFCRVRCGYCDFNTYTADELRGVKQSDYASQAVLEVAHSARILERS